jgi:hypothetical protein
MTAASVISARTTTIRTTVLTAPITSGGTGWSVSNDGHGGKTRKGSLAKTGGHGVSAHRPVGARW